MSTLYRKHECTTQTEVNALALTDGEENGAYVFAPTGEQAYWYAEDRGGHWSYEDGYGGDSIHFPLHVGDTVTVLVPETEEDTLREIVKAVLAEQAHQKAEVDKKRQEFNDEVRRLLEEKYLGDATARVSGFTPRGEA